MILRSPTENENEGVFKGIRHSRTFLAGIQANRNWTPDPFDTAQGRGEPSRTTIKTFGGDALGGRYPFTPTPDVIFKGGTEFAEFGISLEQELFTPRPPRLGGAFSSNFLTRL